MNIAAHWTGPDACRFPATSRPLALLFGVPFKNYRVILHEHAENCFLLARQAFMPDGAAAQRRRTPFTRSFQTGEYACPHLMTRNLWVFTMVTLPTSRTSPPLMVEGNPTTFMQNTGQAQVRKSFARQGFTGVEKFYVWFYKEITRQKSPAGQTGKKQVKAESVYIRIT